VGKRPVIGCDVAKDYCIIHDGRQGFRLDLHNLDLFKDKLQSAIVVLEQTGAYGVRWVQIFENLGAEVYIADGKEFNHYRKGYSSRKDDYTDAYFLRRFFLNPRKRKHCRRFHPQTVNLRALIRQHIRNTFSHALTSLALGELKKLEVAYRLQQELEEEISAVAQNHPDYPILKTFPYFGDITIATLIAFSWDISQFPDKDAYIGYVLMGAFSELSIQSETLSQTKPE